MAPKAALLQVMVILKAFDYGQTWDRKMK